MERRHHSGHLQGQCLYDPDSKLAYVNIPKNASTSMKVALGDKWFPHYVNTGLDVSTHIVILRDPADRYMSAINMFANENPGNSKLISCNWGDEHFETQGYFIEDINHDDITFFYQTDTILSDIAEYFDLPLNVDEHQNKSTPMFSLTDTGLRKTKIAYAKDYELIDSVDFVNWKGNKFGSG